MGTYHHCPPSVSAVNLYSTSANLRLPCHLPLRNLKQGQSYCHAAAANPTVQNVGKAVKTGKKWSAKRALKVAVEDLKHQEIIGTVCRRGLGKYDQVQLSKMQGKPKRDMIV